MRFLALLLLVVAASASAETEIFRCEQPDGTIAFQETPCPEPVEEEEEVIETEEFVGDVEPVSQVLVDEPLPEPTSQDRAVCEKEARDAIDAIDLEMRSTSYTKEESQAYLAELRLLTRQLRACKQL